MTRPRRKFPYQIVTGNVLQEINPWREAIVKNISSTGEGRNQVFHFEFADGTGKDYQRHEFVNYLRKTAKKRERKPTKKPVLQVYAFTRLWCLPSREAARNHRADWYQNNSSLTVEVSDPMHFGPFPSFVKNTFEEAYRKIEDQAARLQKDGHARIFRGHRPRPF